MGTDSPVILLLGENPFQAESTTALREEYQLEKVVWGENILSEISRLQPNAVLLNPDLEDGTCFEVISDIRGVFPELPVIVAAGPDQVDFTARALEAGAWDYLPTPTTNTSFWIPLKIALHRAEIIRRQKNEEGRSPIHPEDKETRLHNSQLEAQLRRMQRMEAIGSLAGGIAHDFNNILGAIIGNTELTQLYVETGKLDEAKKKLAEVLSAVFRARDTIKQILSFSREDEQDQKPIQISHLLKETVHFLRATLPATIGIRREIQKAGMIMADPSRIRQMVINLCTNAAESMRADGGRLEIRLENVELQKPLPAVNALLPACGYVRITVRDSGHGMTGEVQQRIFQPFFTTRREGSGLGLSVVQSILEAHGGGITVESKTGAGSCFRVYLPRIDTPVEKIETGDRRFEPRGQGERILFVDDEPSLVEVGRETLSQLGYTPDCHTDSREALRRFQSAPEVFDLVVTDLTMPELTGLELTEAIRGLRPDIPVILCTGLGDFMTEERSAGSGIRYFLQKPLTRRDLASGIEKALTEKA